MREVRRAEKKKGEVEVEVERAKPPTTTQETVLRKGGRVGGRRRRGNREREGSGGGKKCLRGERDLSLYLVADTNNGEKWFLNPFYLAY